MNKLLFLLFLLMANFSFGQDNDIITFDPRQVVYVLGDSINVREEPAKDAKLVAQLPIGTRLTIIRRTDKVMNLNGFEMPWYYVQINAKQKGYIWGGKIAHCSFRSSKNPDIVFHFGLEKEIDGIATYQVRVEKNHKEIQHLSFEGFGSAMKRHTFTNYGNRGLTNVDDVIYVDGFGEFCGDAGGSIVLFWANGTLYNVRKLSDYSDVPVFDTETFLFPSDMEGKKDLVILQEQAGEYVFDDDDNAANYHAPEVTYTVNKKTAYRWDGKRLLEKK